MPVAQNQHRAGLPTLAELLVAGGDSRILLDPATGANHYGCPITPDPALLAFGSSTASVISTSALAALAAPYHRLQQSIQPRAAFYADAMEGVRQSLVHAFELPPGVDIIFAASGTDIHLIAGQLCRARGAVRVIMAAAVETGSGVPAALSGHHFGHLTAGGATVQPGSLLAADSAIELASIAVRDADGGLRAAAEVEADFMQQVEAALAAGQRPLLVQIAPSKTGIVAPSSALVGQLQQQYGTALDVLVDACQLRITPAHLRAHLQQGRLVAITGSKFVTGPTFSGALLVPSTADRPAPPASLERYCCRGDWPSDWPGNATLPAGDNVGLWLRWLAALHEWRAFQAVGAATYGLIEQLGLAITRRLASDAAFRPMSQASHPTADWDSLPTLFPLLLVDKIGEPLTAADTTRVYRDLWQPTGPSAIRCQVGQPVQVGIYRQQPLMALRLALDARLVVEAANSGVAQVTAKAMAVLDKMAALCRNVR